MRQAQESGKGAGPGLRRSEANAALWAGTAQTPILEGPGEPQGGRRPGAPQSLGAPSLTRALRAGATPRPGQAPRPRTRFLPGAGPGGHKPSAVKFKEVRETLRRNLSSAGK